jgi:hypothetical protein
MIDTLIPRGNVRQRKKVDESIDTIEIRRDEFHQVLRRFPVFFALSEIAFVRDVCQTRVFSNGKCIKAAERSVERTRFVKGDPVCRGEIFRSRYARRMFAKRRATTSEREKRVAQMIKQMIKCKFSGNYVLAKHCCPVIQKSSNVPCISTAFSQMRTVILMKNCARDVAGHNSKERSEGCSLIFIFHVVPFAPREPGLVYIRCSCKAFVN